VPSLSVSREVLVTLLLGLVTVYHLGRKKELLNLLLAQGGLVCGGQRDWANHINTTSSPNHDSWSLRIELTSLNRGAQLYAP
jgi:hypothetical protein